MASSGRSARPNLTIGEVIIEETSATWMLSLYTAPTAPGRVGPALCRVRRAMLLRGAVASGTAGICLTFSPAMGVRLAPAAPTYHDAHRKGGG